MIVTKDEFKQLQKEGGGGLIVDCAVAKLVDGINGLTSGTVGTISVRKNGIFFDILMSKKAFIPIEKVESVDILVDELQIDTSSGQVIFEIKKKKDLDKMYVAINKRLGVSVKTREETQAKMIRDKKRALEDAGEIYCPKCLSTRLEVQKKGYGVGKGFVGYVAAGPIGLLAGGIGKNKLDITCLKCGHKFRPGK